MFNQKTFDDILYFLNKKKGEIELERFHSP